ncbi:hypothetical protein QLQ12_30625 [Actinoplanes sp. NEAU-A12]|uniref:Uncharacterized protein n=1 Tax=Actinoplanes sandaracinus TaxID=3045177 RepID=A0ABT6WH90_9ACTN|nr:hypothetical protein [Actinoplanes sandaracinus]MDI6099084.1 hypothetical protein [Actinoplanes sandaracinus]MDI6102979.1 hypothetical protein [Actinoplanes sandaracinus]
MDPDNARDDSASAEEEPGCAELDPCTSKTDVGAVGVRPPDIGDNPTPGERKAALEVGPSDAFTGSRTTVGVEPDADAETSGVEDIRMDEPKPDAPHAVVTTVGVTGGTTWSQPTDTSVGADATAPCLADEASEPDSADVAGGAEVAVAVEAEKDAPDNADGTDGTGAAGARPNSQATDITEGAKGATPGPATAGSPTCGLTPFAATDAFTTAAGGTGTNGTAGCDLRTRLRASRRTI